MGYGLVTDEMKEVIALCVRGRVVHDLGAGDGEKSSMLLSLGASKVIAIEKEKAHRKSVPGVDQQIVYFNEYEGEVVQVAFISWPANYTMSGFMNLVEQAELVIYLGKNTDWSACGPPVLFHHLIQRRLLNYIPHHLNCLVVCGDKLPSPRKPTGEELAGLLSLSSPNSTSLSFEQAEHEARGAP